MTEATHIDFLIQHHPDRSEVVGDLLEQLPGGRLITDSGGDPPDPWRGYQLCLRSIRPAATHACILQDDAVVCKNFAGAVDCISFSNKDVPVCLFLGAYPASTAVRARRAWLRKRNYIHLGPTSFVPLVACLWPRAKAEEFLEWSLHNKTTRADDGNAARWMRQTKQEVLVTVPSLVEHNDYVPSVKGGRQHKPGAESWRHAVFLAEDGLAYNW